MALIVLSGPSGVGKNTIINEVLKKIPEIKSSRSLTTRKARPNDVPRKYTHVDKKEFQEHIKNGDLLEWAEYNDNLYGTLKPDLNENSLFEIEVKGAAQIKALYPEAHLLLILPPGNTIEEKINVLRERLQKRAVDENETIEKRLAEAKEEISQGTQQSEKIFINDNLDNVIMEIVGTIQSLLQKEGARRK